MLISTELCLSKSHAGAQQVDAVMRLISARTLMQEPDTPSQCTHFIRPQSLKSPARHTAIFETARHSRGYTVKEDVALLASRLCSSKRYGQRVATAGSLTEAISCLCAVWGHEICPISQSSRALDSLSLTRRARDVELRAVAPLSCVQLTSGGPANDHSRLQSLLLRPSAKGRERDVGGSSIIGRPSKARLDKSKWDRK